MSELSQRLKQHERRVHKKLAKTRKEKGMGKKCQKCGERRVLCLYSDPKDLGSIEYRGLKADGYLPDIPNINADSDIDMEICMECGTVQGDFPVSHKVLKKAFADAEEDYEDD